MTNVIRKVTAREAKAKLLALLDAVAAGDEIEITRHGRTVARLVPIPGLLSLKGSLTRDARTAAPGDDLFSTDITWSVS